MPMLFQRASAPRTARISAESIRKPARQVLDGTGLTDAEPASRCSSPPRLPADVRHRRHPATACPPTSPRSSPATPDINTTMGYNAVYPDEAIDAHRAFIARRRALRPGEEYRTPTDEEWEEFLGHFERRKLSLGDLRPRLWHRLHPRAQPASAAPCFAPTPPSGPTGGDPRQPHRPHRRGQREGWLGEVEGLHVSLAAAQQKLAQLDDLTARRAAIQLGMPSFPDVAGHTVTTDAAPA